MHFEVLASKATNLSVYLFGQLTSTHSSNFSSSESGTFSFFPQLVDLFPFFHFYHLWYSLTCNKRLLVCSVRSCLLVCMGSVSSFENLEKICLCVFLIFSLHFNSHSADVKVKMVVLSKCCDTLEHHFSPLSSTGTLIKCTNTNFDTLKQLSLTNYC